jgi:hypothetical protein
VVVPVSPSPDLTADADAVLDHFGILERCLSGADRLADPDRTK